MAWSFRQQARKITLLTALGVALGTGAAFWQESAEMKAGLSASAIAPAAGGDVPGAAVGGAFSLTDENGRQVTEKDYAGGYKLVFFGFTHCPDICPAGLKKISLALDTLGDDAKKIHTLFVTVDPARDTPDIMKTYTDLFDARITGLTGTDEQVRKMQETYKVYAAKVEMPAPESAHDGHGDHAAHGMPASGQDVYTVNHSAFVYLMAPDDTLAAIFRAEDTPEDMAAQIKKVLGQS